MDASKLIRTKGKPDLGLTDAQAIRMAIADELRDIADEIEQGIRVVQDLTSVESAEAGKWPISTLCMRSVVMHKKEQKK